MSDKIGRMTADRRTQCIDCNADECTNGKVAETPNFMMVGGTGIEPVTPAV